MERVGRSMLNNAAPAWLEPEEMHVLNADYRLTKEPSLDRRFSVPFTDLLHSEKCRAYLHGVSGIFETESELATASLFAKRYAYLIIAPGLYAMSRFNKGLDMAVENGSIESSYQGEAWLPKACLADWRASGPQGTLRQEWRDSVIERMFARNLSRVWSAISKTAGIAKAVLWENTAIYVYWLYENKFAENASSEERQRMEEDYHYLIHEAPADLFGEKRNPLMQFNTPKRATAASNGPIRVRKTCCFYYLASDEPEDYCSTCPKLNL